MSGCKCNLCKENKFGEVFTEKWIRYFLTMAYLVAMNSKDKRTRIGAVVVGPDREVRSTGFNGLPRGCKDDVTGRQEAPEKYFYFEHGERNAIYNAAMMGVSMKGCVMFTQGIPCADCARAVIQAGIERVYVHKQWNDCNSEKWVESYGHSENMFDESGTDLLVWSGDLLYIQGRQHEKDIDVMSKGKGWCEESGVVVRNIELPVPPNPPLARVINEDNADLGKNNSVGGNAIFKVSGYCCHPRCESIACSYWDREGCCCTFFGGGPIKPSEKALVICDKIYGLDYHGNP